MRCRRPVPVPVPFLFPFSSRPTAGEEPAGAPAAARAGAALRGPRRRERGGGDDTGEARAGDLGASELGPPGRSNRRRGSAFGEGKRKKTQGNPRAFLGSRNTEGDKRLAAG